MYEDIWQANEQKAQIIIKPHLNNENSGIKSKGDKKFSMFFIMFSSRLCSTLSQLDLLFRFFFHLLLLQLPLSTDGGIN